MKDAGIGGDQTIVDLNNVFNLTEKEGPNEDDILYPQIVATSVNDVKNWFNNQGDSFMQPTKFIGRTDMGVSRDNHGM